jgi:hypothetical protein
VQGERRDSSTGVSRCDGVRLDGTNNAEWALWALGCMSAFEAICSAEFSWRHCAVLSPRYQVDCRPMPL